MYWKYPVILVVFFFQLHIVSAQRAKYNFNSDWKVWVGDTSIAKDVSFNDAAWKAVTLPYAWNEDDAFRVSIEQLRTGIAWYRKHFTIDFSQSHKKVFVEFEGIRHGGEFFVNGQSVGMNEYGVTAFGFDISSLVKFGEDNVIAVRVDNAWNYKEKATNSGFQWNDRNFYANYGGINKNVYLHIANPVYQTLPLYSNLGTTGVYVYAKDIDVAAGSATITAISQVKNDTKETKTVLYNVTIKDMDNKVIKTMAAQPVNIAAGETKEVTASAPVTGLHLWSWGYGYLYNVETTLLFDGGPKDVVTTRTGFRKTAFKDGVLYLNDRVMQMHGYAQRTTNEWPAIGNAVPAWLSDYSNRLMVQGNANLVRWMHVTPWKQDVESCDRVGLIQAMPAGDSEKDVDGRRWEHRKEVMRDAIIYNRNNPSIIFYECGNNAISEQHMQEMKKIRNTFDPYGGRAIGSRNMLDSKEAEYGGEMLYINKSATKPVWQMEYSRDEGLRKYWDEYTPPYHKDGDGPLHNGQDATGYNRNQDSHAKENIVRWFEYWQERPGTGTRVNGGGVNIVFSESNTHHRGAENFRRSGEVDALRIIKENYYANQIMWDGWVDVEKPGIHIIGHWNYKDGVKKDIYVISSAEKVELRINGKSMGFGEQSNRFLYTFKNIAWKPGTIAAVGYDAANKKICNAQISTAGEPAAVKLKIFTDPNGWRADGHDLAMAEFEVVDKNGNRCPTALNMVHFDITGPAQWRGGMAQGPDNYILSKDLPVECGVNRVLIRSTTQAGTVTLKATADGLQPATITVVSKAFTSKDGLATQLPGAGLPSYLDRRPTPATPSFTVQRKALSIVQAKAGSNEDKAAASFDDNESTDWVNDGQASTAWIEYEISKSSAVSGLALKLNNFRTRTYPLKVSVDGKEVFKGNTTRNLGYFDISFAPQTGKKIRIELMGNSSVTGETSTEVNGKKLDDGVARDDANAKGRLSIIEAEFYEKVK
jgi:beta-galactosidase